MKASTMIAMLAEVIERIGDVEVIVAGPGPVDGDDYREYAVAAVRAESYEEPDQGGKEVGVCATVTITPKVYE